MNVSYMHIANQIQSNWWWINDNEHLHTHTQTQTQTHAYTTLVYIYKQTKTQTHLPRTCKYCIIRKLKLNLVMGRFHSVFDHTHLFFSSLVHCKYTIFTYFYKSTVSYELNCKIKTYFKHTQTHTHIHPYWYELYV